MEYRNAKLIADGLIDCEINHPILGWIPFTANPLDVGAKFDVGALHAAMLADPTLAAYIPEPMQDPIRLLAFEMRQHRDDILTTQVDPLVSNPLRWGALTVVQQQRWKDYRLLLLAVPQQVGFPSAINWPVKPI